MPSSTPEPLTKAQRESLVAIAHQGVADFAKTRARFPEVSLSYETTLAERCEAILCYEATLAALESSLGSPALDPKVRAEIEQAFREVTNAGILMDHPRGKQVSLDAFRRAEERVLALLFRSPSPALSGPDYANRNIRTMELANAVARHLGLNPADEIPFEELTRRLLAPALSGPEETKRLKADRQALIEGKVWKERNEAFAVDVWKADGFVGSFTTASAALAIYHESRSGLSPKPEPGKIT